MSLEGLKDGTAVVLRPPTMDDLDRLRAFYLALPEEDRRYLREDVTRREVVERRIREAQTGQVERAIALAGDDVVGAGVLETSGETWHRHLGEIRVIVACDHRRHGLGSLLISELFRSAQRRGVEKVIVKMAAPQLGARAICERLGFHVDAVLPEHIKDSDGTLHDLVVMSCELDDLWRELKGFYKADDWPDG
ncbi:MAG: GNAT family N-acetyltransferase [Planctomycetota bacterium]|jgi:RimJ/RimL family protein N-acetyltransferase